MRSWIAIVFLLVAFAGALTDGHARNNPSTSTDLGEGKKIYESHCAMCHGMDGAGGRGPALIRSRLVLGLKDSALRSLIADGKEPSMPAAWYLSDQQIDEVAAYVRSFQMVPAQKIPGNAARGQTVYERLGCSRCHALQGQGSGFAPDLTGLNERRSSNFVRKTIEDPASTMPTDFVLVRVVTRSGNLTEGIRLNEDTFSIQIKDAEGRPYSFLKADLKSIRKLPGNTPMPSFASTLSPAQLEDLVCFLMSSEAQ